MSRVPFFGYSNDGGRRGRLKIKRPSGDPENWSEALTPSQDDTGTLDQTASRRPLVAIAGAAIMVLGVLGLQMFNLQIVHGEQNLAMADVNRIRQRVIRAPRGVMYDRNGKLLVRNAAQYDLIATPALLPRQTGDRQRIYTDIASLLKVDASTIASVVEPIVISPDPKQSPLNPVLVKGGLEREQALLLDQKSVSLTGFSLDVNPVREYLDGGLLAAFLGYTGRISPEDLLKHTDYTQTDYIGKVGLERQYEADLKGQNGSEQTEVDSTGQPIKVLANKPASPGSSLVLTINGDLQQVLATSLQAHMEAAGATQSAAVAMNPKTGEILAAVSLPSYDNNLFSRGISQTDFSRLVNDAAQPLYNKVTSGAYPSGSIIKPIVASAALEEHVVTPQTTIEDKGFIEVVNKYDPSVKYTFNGWEKTGLGVMNVFRAIAMSSDIYFYTVAGGFGDITGLGVSKLTSYYQKFGLGSRTGVDLPDETAGRVPTPEWKQRVSKEPWYTGDTYNISVGQGDILVSPLQMATAISVIANGGTLIKPHFLKAVTDEQGKIVREATTEVVRRNLVAQSTIDTVREGMRQVITSGTACCLIEQQVPVHVAGKTGTAETDPNAEKKAHAWFEAFAPYEDPEIVIVALVENSGEGAQFAAPVVREALTWYFTHPH